MGVSYLIRSALKARRRVCSACANERPEEVADLTPALHSIVTRSGEPFRTTIGDMKMNTLTEASLNEGLKLRWFTLYADYPAGIRARKLIARMSEHTRGLCQSSSELWKLDAVAPVGPIRRMIAQEAGECDVLLISISATQPDRTVLEWLKSLVPWKCNRLVPGLIIGLLRDDSNQVDETNWLFQELNAFARQTGMALAWQVSRPGSGNGCDWIACKIDSLVARKQSCAVP